tara:strand:- start:1370 stop:2380 length:1011 start_codon:yes stop_codon:yes gene_type:complete
VDNTQNYVRHLSLCTGYGGIDLGLRRVLPTCRTIAYCEIEAYAIQNLVEKIEAGQMDEAPIWSNLETFPFQEFYGCVDILSGGIPCQPFSNAGAKEGVGDERHLYPFISEGIKQCRPSILFFENVEGMFSTYTEENEVVLHYVLKDLESMGYTATAGIFSAEEIGFPHQRRRIYALGFEQDFISNTNSSRSGGGWSSCRSETNTDRVQGSKGEWYGIRSKIEGCSSDLSDVSNTDCKGMEGKRKRNSKKRWEVENGHSGCDSQIWVSAPDKPQKEWEEPRVIRSVKSKLGGTTNGSKSGVDTNQNRIDRLRLLGNGVVPSVAEKAFRVLSQELFEV